MLQLPSRLLSPTTPPTLVRGLVAVTFLFLFLDVTLLAGTRPEKQTPGDGTPPPGHLSTTLTFLPEDSFMNQPIAIMLSFLSPIRGFVPAALSCAFWGMDTLETRENQLGSPRVFVIQLLMGNLCINLSAWTFLWAWSVLLPSPAPFPVLGWGGLGSMVVFCDVLNESGSENYGNSVEGFFPFRVARKWRPVVLALVLHIFRAGDVDLICAVACGRILKEIFGSFAVTPSSSLLPSFHGYALVTQREDWNDESLAVSGTPSKVDSVPPPPPLSREERRNQMLSAVESRVSKLLG